MSALLSNAFRRLSGMDKDRFRREAMSDRGPLRGFDPVTWAVVGPVVSVALDAFYETLEDPRTESVMFRLAMVPGPMRGFAYEGVGMALEVLDRLNPTRRRLVAFREGPALDHQQLVMLGVGMILNQIPARLGAYLRRQDPLLRWWVMDGYGCIDGILQWTRSVQATTPPRQVLRIGDPYAVRSYDHGLGRSIWFTTGARFDRITTLISAFPAARRPDLWAGIGLASAFAGGGSEEDIVERLLAAAGPYAADMAVGNAIACYARSGTELPAEHTEAACKVVWDGLSARSSEPVTFQRIAEMVRMKRRDLPADSPELPSHEVWRLRMRDEWLGLADPVAQDRGPATERRDGPPTSRPNRRNQAAGRGEP